MTNENKLIDWREELYQAFHNMPSGVDKRTEKFHEIAKMIDSVFHSHTKEVVEKIRGMKKENYTNKDIEDQLRIFTVTPVSDVAIKEFARTINNVSSKLGYNSALDDLLASLEDNKK